MSRAPARSVEDGFENQRGHSLTCPASSRRPASVIRTRATSIPTTRSLCTVASRALTSPTSSLTVTPASRDNDQRPAGRGPQPQPGAPYPQRQRQPYRFVSSGRHLCRPHSERRKAWRAAVQQGTKVELLLNLRTVKAAKPTDIAYGVGLS
jgi:hypothetical protein